MNETEKERRKRLIKAGIPPWILVNGGPETKFQWKEGR